MNQKQVRVELLRYLGEVPEGRLEAQVRRHLAEVTVEEVTLALDWAKTQDMATRHPGTAVSANQPPAEKALVLTDKGGDWIRANG